MLQVDLATHILFQMGEPGNLSQEALLVLIHPSFLASFKSRFKRSWIENFRSKSHASTIICFSGLNILIRIV